MATENKQQTDWQEEYDKTAGELARSRIDAWQLLNENEEMRALLEEFAEIDTRQMSLADFLRLQQAYREWLEAHPKGEGWKEDHEPFSLLVHQRIDELRDKLKGEGEA